MLGMIHVRNKEKDMTIKMGIKSIQKSFRDSLIVKKVLVKVKKPLIDVEYKEFEEIRRLSILNNVSEKNSPRRSEKSSTTNDV